MAITDEQLDIITHESANADCYVLLTISPDGEGSIVNMHRNISDKDTIILLQDAITRIVMSNYEDAELPTH